MIRKHAPLPLSCLLISVLAGCAYTPYEEGEAATYASRIPHALEGGVLVAAGVMETEENYLDTTGVDCSGPARTKVSILSVAAGHEAVYNAQGQPCALPKVVFEGTDPHISRAADPAIKIKFSDYGGRPQDPEERLLPVVTALGDTAPVLPEDFALAPGKAALIQNASDVPEGLKDIMQGEKGQDAHTKRVQAWRLEEERLAVLRESERLLAGARDLRRMQDVDVIREHQEEIQRLLARLRDVEREKQSLEERKSESLIALEQTRERSDATRLSLEQEHSKMRSTLEQQAAAIKQLEREKQAMSMNMQRKESVYEQQLTRLNADLDVTRALADKNRQELILEAAKKVAEAERLAYAARVQKQTEMQQEAARLRGEADTLMVRANSLENGRQIVVPGLSDLSMRTFESDKMKTATGGTALIGRWTDIPLTDETGRLRLEEIELSVYEKDQPLKTIVGSIFGVIGSRAGAWDVSWQLMPEYAHIADEKWTIAAESRLDEILAYIARRVREDHGVQLSFQQYDGIQRFLITQKSGK